MPTLESLDLAYKVAQRRLDYIAPLYRAGDATVDEYFAIRDARDAALAAWEVAFSHVSVNETPRPL